jgi:hypothetical protein
MAASSTFPPSSPCTTSPSRASSAPGSSGELGLPGEAMSLDGVEYYGGVGYLKAGLQAAWAITTVSPTYAHEIRTPEYGMGLDGLINARAPDLVGIVNGIDVGGLEPRNGHPYRPHLCRRFPQAARRQPAGTRRALQPRTGRRPDLLRRQPAHLAEGHRSHRRDVADWIVGEGGKLAVLGSGDQGLRARCLPPPRAIVAASASSSAITNRCPISCRPAPTRSSSRRASSPAASPSSTACATAAFRSSHAPAALPIPSSTPTRPRSPPVSPRVSSSRRSMPRACNTRYAGPSRPITSRKSGLVSRTRA